MSNFNSSNFAFRPTALAAAMVDAGLIETPHLVREPLQTVTRADKQDKPHMIKVRAA